MQQQNAMKCVQSDKIDDKKIKNEYTNVSILSIQIVKHGKNIMIHCSSLLQTLIDRCARIFSSWLFIFSPSSIPTQIDRSY